MAPSPPGANMPTHTVLGTRAREGRLASQEFHLVLLNTDAREPFVVEPGMRIAQLVVLPVADVELVVVDALPETERSVRGFGSSAL